MGSPEANSHGAGIRMEREIAAHYDEVGGCWSLLLLAALRSCTCCRCSVGRASPLVHEMKRPAEVGSVDEGAIWGYMLLTP